MFRRVLNNSIGSGLPNDEDMAAYEKEGRAMKKKIEVMARSALERKVLSEIATNNTKWNLTVNGQNPTSLSDVIKAVSDPLWIGDQEEKEAAKIVAHLVVGIFVTPGDEWLVQLEHDIMKTMRIDGYEGGKMRRGCIYKIAKRTANYKWKGQVRTSMERNLDFYVGGRDEGKVKKEYEFTSIETFTNYAAYIAKKRGTGVQADTGNLEEVRRAVELHLRRGGTTEQVAAMLQDMSSTGECVCICTCNCFVYLVSWK